MNSVRFLRWVMAGLGVSFLLPSACGSSGVVGGECLPEFTKCGGICTDLRRSSTNCGVCGNQCPGGLICESGACVPGGDGSAVGGAAGDGAGGVAGSQTAGSAGSAGLATGGTAAQGGTTQGGSGGTQAAGGSDATGGTGATGGIGETCFPPHDEPSHCGACNIQCTGATPFCSPNPGSERGFECVEACTEPYTQCGGRCVDTRTDPENCGACGNVCVSGICQDSKCVGAKQGHVVMTCMNYLHVRRDSSHAILLGNAVFYRNVRRVRILAYTEHAPVPERNKVNTVIGWESTARGRNYEIENLTKSADIPTRLVNANFEVFLVYDQSNAPAGTLATIGSNWATHKAVENFAKAGGIVVILTSATGTAEMDQLLTQSGLLAVSDTPAITDWETFFYNRAPADAIAANVEFPFVAVPEACTYTTSATPGPDVNFVATDNPGPDFGAPLVVHRVFAP